MNITKEMAATNAKKVKVTRTSVGWLFLPSCALFYQCQKYFNLHSDSNLGYAVGLKFWKWLNAEL
eukprot:6208841-Pleurochrysis_carterae.AAC.4